MLNSKPGRVIDPFWVIQTHVIYENTIPYAYVMLYNIAHKVKSLKSINSNGATLSFDVVYKRSFGKSLKQQIK